MIEYARFFREIRNFAVTTPDWGVFIEYQIKQDEIWDLTLVSRRVYGNPDDYLAIMAAAGLDRTDMPLLEGSILRLPDTATLSTIKRISGITIPTVRLR